MLRKDEAGRALKPKRFSEKEGREARHSLVWRRIVLSEPHDLFVTENSHSSDSCPEAMVCKDEISSDMHTSGIDCMPSGCRSEGAGNRPDGVATPTARGTQQGSRGPFKSTKLR